VIILNDIKEYLTITESGQDSKLAGFLNNSISEIERYCNRKFKYNTYTEYYDGDGLELLYTRTYPLKSITSIKYYDTETEVFIDLIDGTGDTIANSVEITNDYILLRKGYVFPAGTRNIQIVCVAGYKCLTGTGTISITIGTKAVTGVSTLFTTEATAGDIIQCQGEEMEINVITNNTGLTVIDNANVSISGKNYVIKTTPDDLKQVLIEKVALKYFDSVKGRLGISSENIGSQASQSYTFKDVDHKEILNKYKMYSL